MGLADVRNYFREKLDDLGYLEWRDGFATDNIPSSIFDKSYHINSGDISSTAKNHQVNRFDCPIVLSVYFKGYNDPLQAIDDAYIYCESILNSILLPSNILVSNLQSIEPQSISVQPLSTSNDNAVILEINFLAITYLKF